MMSILLDTCALIWLGNGDSALSLDARQMISDDKGERNGLCLADFALGGVQ